MRCTALLCGFTADPLLHQNFTGFTAPCVQGARREASQLIPGSMRTMDVALTSPGPWLVQCRTAKHQANGMTATIDVAPNGAHHRLVHAHAKR